MEIVLSDVERVLEEELDAGAEVASLGLTYAFAIQNAHQGHRPNWARMNLAIRAQRGLATAEEVKRIGMRLWKEKRADAEART